MNATELFHKDGKSAGVFYCEQCRIVHRTSAEAEQCCRPYKCSVCGTECLKPYTICDKCRRKEEQRKEAERFAKAEKLTEWDGPVYCEGTGNDGFSSSIDDLIDEREDEEADMPEYVWACSLNHFVAVDIDEILQRITENGYPDFDASYLAGIPELEKAIEAFNVANVGVVSWEPDYKRAVLVPKGNTDQ